MTTTFSNGKPNTGKPSTPSPKQNPPFGPSRNNPPSPPVYVPGKAMPRVPNPKK